MEVILAFNAIVLRRVDPRVRWHMNGAKAGRASAEARRGRGELLDQMRRLAPLGGHARHSAMSAEERRRYSAEGGRASWARLTPKQALRKRLRAARASKLVISHQQRVENGRKGAAVRWGAR